MHVAWSRMHVQGGGTARQFGPTATIATLGTSAAAAEAAAADEAVDEAIDEAAAAEAAGGRGALRDQ